MANSPKRSKASKGTVVIQEFRGRLRLVWSYAGKRYFLYLELPVSKSNRIFAEAKAKQIEKDIASDNFDRTLAKYKPQPAQQSIKVAELFQKFINHKTKRVYQQTLAKYQALLGHLNQFFREKPTALVGEAEAEKFKSWLADRLAPITVRERVTLLRACWNWGIKHKLVEANPWLEVEVKVPPKQRPRPFTKAEMERIIQGFRGDRYYAHYADYVEFLLGTGCRIGEAIALQWKHLTDDCSVVWLGESYYRGQRKETKTNQARFVRLTSKLQQMLLARRPANYQQTDLVFPSPKGCPIDDHNFRNRAWKKMLGQLGIDYRRPYNSRHSFTSHALDGGMSPLSVSEITGNTVEVIYRSYAGNVRGMVTLPDLLGN